MDATGIRAGQQRSIATPASSSSTSGMLVPGLRNDGNTVISSGEAVYTPNSLLQAGAIRHSSAVPYSKSSSPGGQGPIRKLPAARSLSPVHPKVLPAISEEVSALDGRIEARFADVERRFAELEQRFSNQETALIEVVAKHISERLSDHISEAALKKPDTPNRVQNAYDMLPEGKMEAPGSTRSPISDNSQSNTSVDINGQFRGLQARVEALQCEIEIDAGQVRRLNARIDLLEGDINAINDRERLQSLTGVGGEKQSTESTDSFAVDTIPSTIHSKAPSAPLAEIFERLTTLEDDQRNFTDVRLKKLEDDQRSFTDVRLNKLEDDQKHVNDARLKKLEDEQRSLNDEIFQLQESVGAFDWKIEQVVYDSIQRARQVTS